MLKKHALTSLAAPQPIMSKCIGQECTQNNARLECPGCIKYELPSVC